MTGVIEVRGDRHAGRARYLVPLLGVLTVLLTLAGLSGLGDAPPPHVDPAFMADHFQDVDDAILASAPLGTLGAVALGAFLVALAGRLHRGGQSMGRPAGQDRRVHRRRLLPLHPRHLHVAGRLGGGHVARGHQGPVHPDHPRRARVGAGRRPGPRCCLLRGEPDPGAARLVVGRQRRGSGLRRHIDLLYADHGFFSPDVQQQVVSGVLFVWLILTAAVLARRP